MEGLDNQPEKKVLNHFLDTKANFYSKVSFYYDKKYNKMKIVIHIFYNQNLKTSDFLYL